MTGILGARARKAARLGLSRTLQLGTAPLRTLARVAIRLCPRLETRLAGWAWLWQPGWGRWCHERLYRTPDPYGAEASAYEQSKYDLIMETLAGGHYDRALDVGCGEGLLSVRLVELAAELVGVDISDVAIGRARQRLDGDAHARFERRTLPLDMPEGTFDLIVCSDVLYYWEPATLRTGIDRLLAALRPGGTLLLLHYLGDFGQASTGDTVHDLFDRQVGRSATLTHVLARTLPDTGPDEAGIRFDVVHRHVLAGPRSRLQRTTSFRERPD